MNEDVKQREYLSALVDGELNGETLTQTLAFSATDDGRQLWALYHLVGDTLRSPELVHQGGKDVLAAVRAEMARAPLAAPVVQAQPASLQLKPGTLEQVAPPAQARAANGAVFRWKMVAGLASLAAVSVLGWNMALVSHGASAVSTVATVPPPVQVAARAAVPAAPVAPATTMASAPALATFTAQADTPGEQVMLRDPRLDELVAAHRHYHGANNLQMPAGFLRNATFASQQTQR